MKQAAICALCVLVGALAGRAQSVSKDESYALALPAHNGQLKWNAAGFSVVQTSAKPNNAEIGVRAKDSSGQYTFLGFLFLVPGETAMTSAKCRDGVLAIAKKSNPTMTIAGTSQMARSDGPPVELAGYLAQGQDGKVVYSVRGFLAVGDLCGDLEIYGDQRSVITDPNLKKIWESYRLDPQYVPQYGDLFVYAQILYQNHQYQAAAPIFEEALSKLPGGTDPTSVRRMTTDQAGMAYGLAGNIPKARALFNAAIEKDPDYPLYYFNLTCADAEEKKLADARTHLQEAFARKANVIPGETMPDPTKDDSFLPYRRNEEFWAFVESLH